ncbi:MAG: hypothetical protein IKG22_16405 [Atopobiaceae bacterium]|nr:hypothetical protein [Atopobiaceae bacterium]
MAEICTLNVPTLDRAPMWGTGGELVPLAECDGKSMAAKLTEEAAEAYESWQCVDGCEYIGKPECLRTCLVCEFLADELADLIVLACDLAKVHKLDLQAALDRCGERNRERGRINP